MLIIISKIFPCYCVIKVFMHDMNHLEPKPFDYDFIIVHNSKFNGNLGQLSRYNGLCPQFSKDMGLCYGGFERFMTA